MKEKANMADVLEHQVLQYLRARRYDEHNTVGREILDSLIFRILGFNFRIVRYTCIHYSIAQKISFGFNFPYACQFTIIKSIQKTGPTVAHVPCI